MEQATEYRRSGKIVVRSVTLNESYRDIDRTNLSGVVEGSNTFLLAGHIVAGNGGCTWFIRAPNQIYTLN